VSSASASRALSGGAAVSRNASVVACSLAVIVTMAPVAGAAVPEPISVTYRNPADCSTARVIRSMPSL